MTPALSVVIPAYNEEKYLPTTLAAIQRAARHTTVEVLVVDNGSTDATAEVALRLGATVVAEPRRSIAAARNTGATRAATERLFFIDADTAIPDNAINEVLGVFDRGGIGGALLPIYWPSKPSVRALCRIWEWYAAQRNIAQGVAMFCTRTAFFRLGGFDESMFMAEDSDFYQRLCRYAERAGKAVTFLGHVPVHPSLRRHEQWPAWKMIFWTNPLTTRLFLRSRRFWRGWYDAAPR